MTNDIIHPTSWSAHQLNSDWVELSSLVEPGESLEVPDSLGQLLLDPLFAEKRTSTVPVLHIAVLLQVEQRLGLLCVTTRCLRQTCELIF